MKKIKTYLLLAAVTSVLGLQVGNVVAQDQRSGRGSWDPEAMRQRIMDHLREQMEVKGDDEWKIISDRLTKVMEARREVSSGGGMGMRSAFGRSGGGSGGGSSSSTNSASSDSSSSDRRSRFSSFMGQPLPEEEALQKAIDAKAPAAEIKTKLAALREARKQKESKLEKAQEDLRKVLSVKQEAVAVVNGLLK